MQPPLIIFSLTLLYVTKSVLTQLKGSSCIDKKRLSGTCLFIGDDECKHILELRVSGSTNYHRCGIEDGNEVVCCAKRKMGKEPERPDLNKRYVRECEQYKKQMFDSEIIFTRLIAGGRPTISTTSKCNQYSFPLVVDGENAEPKEFPHMALLGCKTANGTYKWKCGGTLISTNYVLTAAHCFESADNDCEQINIVRLGELDIHSDSDDADPKDFEISDVIYHPRYNNSLVYNDIALLKLDKNVTMNKYIRPACLPYGDSNNTSKLIITGWGATKNAGASASHLQKALVEEFMHNECNKIHFENKKLPSGLLDRTQICAGSRNSEKDTCQGDSGGPLQAIHPIYPCMYSIVGITSHGQACGFQGIPGIYTRVYNYIEWIEAVVWDD